MAEKDETKVVRGAASTAPASGAVVTEGVVTTAAADAIREPDIDLTDATPVKVTALRRVRTDRREQLAVAAFIRRHEATGVTKPLAEWNIEFIAFEQA